MLSLQYSSCSRRHNPEMGSSLWLSFTATTSIIITIWLLFPAAISQAQILNTDNHVFGPFDPSYYDIFDVRLPAAISNAALQVTPDSAGNFTLTNTSGRIFYKQPFKLWEDDFNGKVASFNTSFLVNVFRVNNATPGEGLAFMISPAPDFPPSNSHGQYLGLTNSTTDGNATNQFVAIELDTVKQDFDPDDNHIGININSIRSKVNVSLAQFGFQISPNGTRFYVLWVDYDGAQKVLDVYMAEQHDKDAPIEPKPTKPVMSYNLDLKDVVKQTSYFGFSASTGENIELNCVLRWNITLEVLPEEDNTERVLKISLGVGLPLLVLILVSVSGLVYYLCRKKRACASDPNILGALKSLPGTPREFTFKELKKATNNFDERRKLGQGGFGVVYRGTLQKENLEVAVKKFSRDNMKSKDDFLAELTIINRLRHKHLVRLLGWCHKNGILLLVYEFMPNGSLDNHLFTEEGTSSSTPLLSWQLRYKIISGVASALHYLHNEYDQKVIHRDLKASNIMLDSNFNARLGDFGLARAIENEKTSYAELEGVPGTVGYIAPECFHTGRATRESDVYGFGAVLLEVACGQRPWTKHENYNFLVDWVWCLHREGRILDAVDAKLGNEYVAQEAERILKLGLACSHPIASERPKMQTVVQIISGSVPAPHVPPFKPAFVWPAVDLESLASDLTSTTSTEYAPFNTHSSMHVQLSDDSQV